MVASDPFAAQEADVDLADDGDAAWPGGAVVAGDLAYEANAVVGERSGPVVAMLPVERHTRIIAGARDRRSPRSDEPPDTLGPRWVST